MPNIHPTPALDRLWYTRCPVPTPLGLASQLGWFLDEFRDDGIGVFTLQEADQVSLRESHYDHHLTNSFRQGGNVPAIWARARTLDGASTRREDCEGEPKRQRCQRRSMHARSLISRL